jgi:hypothetical protein
LTDGSSSRKASNASGARNRIADASSKYDAHRFRLARCPSTS